MTALSNVDIEKELVKGNILIYPFKKDNIKSASYNLTASHLGWKIPEKNGESYVNLYNYATNRIIIPGKSSALIVTNEAIWVSEEIAGTYHSKVKLVSEGLGHIGTVLDPGYLGVSVITVHNHTVREIELIPEETIFASIMFQFVKTKSEPDKHGNRPGRPDILNRVGLKEEQNRWLDEPFRNYKERLREKLKEGSPDFQDLEKKYKKNKFDFLIPYVIYLSFILASSSLAGFLSNNQTKLKQSSWYSTTSFLAEKATVGFTGALIVQLVSDIQRKNK